MGFFKRKKDEQTETKVSGAAESPKGNLAFIQAVARYFMDFLETDFHKRKNPRRSVKFRNADNLSVGLDLKEFDTFRQVVWKVINDSFAEPSISVRKGQHQTQMPKDLLELVRLYTDKIDQGQINNILDEIEKDMRGAAITYPNDYDEAVSFSLKQSGAIFKKSLVIPLIKYIERPLEKLRSSDENTIFLIEEELTEGLVNFIAGKLSHILNLLIHKEIVDVTEILKSHLNIKDVRAFISSYFDNYRVTDLFAKIYELQRNRNILDKQDFYFYFCEIAFDKAQYPLFYIPINVISASEVLTLVFDSRIYVNKKALDFVRQEYNSQTGKKGTLSIDKRILYTAELQGNLATELQYILQNIANFFELDNSVNLKNPDLQKSRSLFVRVSNSLHIALFDKSDEAIINDYEEILNLSPTDPLVQQFNLLVDNFIHKNPTSFENEIEDHWDSLETTEKLISGSPIPLNEEQRRVLNAISKDNCKYLTIEGPPGTGKSHTITAIVFNAILKNQSVLVLSDKKEALDVVEDKISSTMDKVRLDRDLQNPILRLGQTGTTYNQILSSSVISQIETHVKAVKKDYDSLNNAIDSSLTELKEGVISEVTSYQHIKLTDIKELENLETEISSLAVLIDFEECLDIETSPTDLEEIRELLREIKSKSPRRPLSYDTSKHLSEAVVAKIDDCKKRVQNLNRCRDELNNSYSLLSSSFDSLSELSFCIEELENIQKLFKILQQSINDKQLFCSQKALSSFVDQITNLQLTLETLKEVREISQKTSNVFKDQISSIKLLNSVTIQQLSHLKVLIDKYQTSRHWLLGYIGKGRRVTELNLEFNKLFPDSQVAKPHKKLVHLKNAHAICSYVCELRQQSLRKDVEEIDTFNVIFQNLKNLSLDKHLDDFIYTTESILSSIEALKKRHPKSTMIFSSISDLRQISNSCRFISALSSFREDYSTVSSLVSVEDFFSTKSLACEAVLNCDLIALEDHFANAHDFFRAMLNLIKQIDSLNTYSARYPNTFNKSGLLVGDFKTLSESSFLSINEEDFKKLIRYISLKQEITSDFESVVPVNYLHETKAVEELVTTKMTFLMDERVVNFTRNFKAESRVLRDIIRSKKQFPKEQFAKLKEAFPCILAGIRDYAEYIPLEPEIFDLVIIDEASQVSIAQSFPALFRAKKIIVLGDKKQFSNVKSAHARSDINREYINQLDEVFRAQVSQNLTELEKLKKFDIKTSILDFFEFINNYRARLLKHFRGYKEIIGYSNKHFYDNTLQVMKIRGISIDEVIKFTVLKHDGKIEKLANTNYPEIEFIITQLQQLKEAGTKPSVGIITPHTNQQKILYDKINESADREYYFETLKLKIMTFDTCQGEERDLIFYSMVATLEDDKLSYVFIKDLTNIDLEEEGQIKAQRLNVGLSRAKECVHFVLSKPIEEFKGEIGNALRYYFSQLQDARREVGTDTVESKMEENVLHHFYQTQFWLQNKERIEFTPQFELGEYLKQLDPRYNHPKYRVDFLLMYSDHRGTTHRIIIEYDGFREHFRNTEGISRYNYESYYSEEDVYRQKVLEGYGYKFLRVNKFNIGKNPVQVLDQRLTELTKEQERTANLLDSIKKKIVGLEDGTMKECPKCKEVKSNKDFFDNFLASKYGRFCKTCKNQTIKEKKLLSISSQKTASIQTTKESNGSHCPKCNSAMRLRKGKYGKFYGCSKFPYCRGTREYRATH